MDELHKLILKALFDVKACPDGPGAGEACKRCIAKALTEAIGEHIESLRLNPDKLFEDNREGGNPWAR